MNDTTLLIRSTCKLYLRVFKSATTHLLSIWWLPLAHLVVSAGVAIAVGLVARYFGIVGSFAAGLALAFVVALYLASVRAVVSKESLSGIMNSAQALFFPVIHVLFMFFILELLLGFMLSGANANWIRVCIGLLITIFGNVLPELIYIRGLGGSDLFTESYEFIIENWIEWFAPFIPLVLVAMVFLFGFNLETFFAIFQVHPLRMIENLILFIGPRIFVIQLWPYLIGFIYLLFFMVLFRAALFEELVYSSRRKRIYAERTGI